MTIAAESSMLSGPWSVLDPVVVSVLAASETCVVAAAVIASAAVAITSADNYNQQSARDVASLSMAVAASSMLGVPLSVATTAANSDINQELIGGNVVRGAGTKTCSIITRATKTSLCDYHTRGDS